MTVPEAVLLVCINLDGSDLPHGLRNCIKCALTSVTSQFPNKTINVNKNKLHKHRAFCILLDKL